MEHDTTKRGGSDAPTSEPASKCKPAAKRTLGRGNSLMLSRAWQLLKSIVLIASLIWAYGYAIHIFMTEPHATSTLLDGTNNQITIKQIISNYAYSKFGSLLIMITCIIANLVALHHTIRGLISKRK